MSDGLIKNLNLLMTESGLNAEELSRRTGLPASTIKKLRNNVDANPTLSTLAPLANYFSLKISQLIGDQPMPECGIINSYYPNPETFKYVPLIQWQDVIQWPNINIQILQKVSTEHSYSNETYALSVEESDWENLPKDTILLVDPKLKAEHRDFIIVLKDGQKTPTLKQILYDEEQIYLKPVVHGYNITAFTSDHLFLGVVVEYKKKLRKK